MKKMIAMLLALVMAMSLMACGKQNDSNANGNNDANTGDDQPAAKTTLVVGVSADYAPFEFMYPDESGNMVYGGIDISVAQYVADELGLTLQVENMSFNNLLTSLDKGDFDMVLSAMEATPDRLENADFSTGYYSDTPPAILVKADKADQYKTLADFNGKAMGAQAATTKLDMVNDIEGVNAVSLESVLDLVNELVYDKVDAILVDGGVAQQYADANPDLVICSASSELPTAEPYCIAVAKGDPKGLLDGINAALAKMASDFEKPDRVHTLYKYEVETKMWPLPVGDLFGVGPSAAKRLNSCGIYTIGDLARLERDTAVKLFGSRGDTLWNYANGREADPVTKQRTRDNSYGNSVTMPRDLARPADADATMLALCDSVGRRLRADGKTARVVTVQLVDNAFRRTSHQTTLPNPTNSTDRLYHVAIELMRQMWPQRPVRLVGVSAEKTGEDNFEQMDLFTDAARIDKQEKLDRAADALRRKFGGAAVTRATLLSPDTRKPEALSAAKERDKK